MKNFYLFILFLLIAAGLKAQQALPPVYEIKADTAVSQIIDNKYWQMLEDPSGKLTIGQVSSEPFASKFHINTIHQKRFDYHITTYWLRYRFKNLLPHQVKLTIPEGVVYARLYTQDSYGKWNVETTGTLVPWSKRDGLKRITQFLVSIQPEQEIVFYERDNFNFWLSKPKVLALSIGFADPVIKKYFVDNDQEYIDSVIYSILLGILLLAAFINFLFYTIVREKVYLYFSTLNLLSGLYSFLNNTNVVFREHRHIAFYAPEVCAALLFFVLLQFTRYFLSTRKFTPHWDRFLIVLGYLGILAWLTIFTLPPTINYQIFTTIELICSVILNVYFLFPMFTLLYYLGKNKAANLTGTFALLISFTWYGIGYFYFFISYLLYQFYNIQFPKIFFWLQSRSSIIELICSGFIVITFFWILFKRFQDLQQKFIQSSLDNERLAKEKEIERSQLIEKQNVELEQKVESRTVELKKTIGNLKQTQQQLIQSEKLASLGELTAGIAHEIQNPLNFVNNFSEVSMELVDEMKEELEKGDVKEASTIATDIKQNLEKIHHHGQRADGIVKGMLQHSRNNSGERQLTDLNVLADEYLRLSYHGLRAKDKVFNAIMTTHYQENMPKINIVPQDIGRVLLNLFNNAFYAVQQKQKTAGTDYKPEVTVSTSFTGTFLTIKVKDNGTGISEAIKDKIMQPFFTTKPTGEGTGLGLSLSYDIVVKGHGGKLDIVSEEGKGSEFLINLPVKV